MDKAGSKPSFAIEIELLPSDFLGVKFSYDKLFVEALRGLGNRKWNPKKLRWEVHLSHLDELTSIFNLKPEQIPAGVREKFESEWKRRPLKVVLDPLHGQITGSGISRETLAEIDRQTSFPLPGYKFSPKFQSGQWDGMKHLFDRKKMEFPSGLWPKIEAMLRAAKLEYELIPPTWPAHKRHKWKKCITALRPYQQLALESALKHERGILQIATGGGKTLLAAHLIQSAGVKTFFFVHTRDLLHQTVAVFERELGMRIGKLGDGFIEIEDITVATIQTAARALGLTTPHGPRKKKSEDEDEGGDERPTSIQENKAEITAAIASAGMVIFDECHHVPADTFYKIAFKTRDARWRFGLSATPWRDDGHDLLLEAALGPKLCEVSCSHLIEAGFLVAPEILMEKAPMPVFNRRGVAYPDIYRLAIVENQARNRAIAARATEWAAGGLSVLVLVNHIEHGNRLMEMMPEAQFAYGNLDSETRRGFIQDLERKLRPILIATTLADEGLDIPHLDALILGGGGQSAVKAYQRLGRTLRKTDSKHNARVLDFMDICPYLQDHSLARLALYRHETRFKIETKGFRV